MLVARDWGGGNEELLFKGYKVSVMQHEGVLGICYTDLCPQLIILYCTLKTLRANLTLIVLTTVNKI